MLSAKSFGVVLARTICRVLGHVFYDPPSSSRSTRIACSRCGEFIPLSKVKDAENTPLPGAYDDPPTLPDGPEGKKKRNT